MKKIITFAILALAAVGFSACNDDLGGGKNKRSNIELAPSEWQVNEANNLFAGKLLYEMSKANPDKNIMFSPLSIQMVMSMVANGADGETLEEIIKGLGFDGMDLKDINSYNAKLLKTLPHADSAVEFALANSLWYTNNWPVNQNFINSCADNYNASIFSIDLEDENKALETINQWVATSTNNKINKILDKFTDSKREALLLANALYFKGSWTEKFSKERTKTASFFNSDDSESKVDIMYGGHAKSKMLDNNLVCLSLPYGNQSFSFDIIYPAYLGSLNSHYPVATIDDALAWLKENTLPAAKEIERNAGINLLKFTQTDKFDAHLALSQLGITKVFDKDKSNLSKMLDVLPGYIAKVPHSCTISCDESGAEVAATTVGEGIHFLEGGVNVCYTIDHPFVYMIRENSTGAILLMGKIMKM